ncbi:MAG: DUF1015 family protein [Tissierellia bacterium]|nr:DUF1015 family protein [Tissierellia bacterium]
MLSVKPFKAYRPQKELVEDFVVAPYDVVTDEEIQEIKRQKPNSFINVIHSEVNCPKVNPYDPKVYQEAKKRLDAFIADGILFQEEEATFYIYEEEMKGHCQRGIVYIEEGHDYWEGKILKHELTLKAKERDRKNHFQETKMQTEPVFFFSPQLRLREWKMEKLYDFVGEDGTCHRLWKILPEDVAKVQKTLEDLEHVYIADGHHRTASAAEIAKQFSSGILAVVFPGEELHIEPYHRMVRSFHGKTNSEIVEALREYFVVTKGQWKGEPMESKEYYLLTEEGGYQLKLREDKLRHHVVKDLDASIVQDYILAPVFGIQNPREDDNLDFCGGLLTVEESKELLKKYQGLILMPATEMEEIVHVAEEGLIMPPKSTWFEPKLISGLFLYSFE